MQKRSTNPSPLAATKNLLLILTRNPELGKCKTRLAAKVGDEIALRIYKFLLDHTHSITRDLDVSKHVYYSDYVGVNDLWDEGGYQKFLQEGPDLGSRLKRAFEFGFDSGHSNIIVIGSDLHDLSKHDLEKAFDVLKDHDAVIGPATDGGYYLLGIRSLIPAVFHNKKWGTETVFRDTMSDLKNLNVAVLQERNDVDRYEDIADNPVFSPFLIDLPS